MKTLPFRLLFVLCLAVAAVSATACARQATAPTPQKVMVAMADDVKLATDVYLPTTGKPPYPTILVRTPYSRGSGKGIAANFCPRGFAVVAQDMRGRFDSEGHHAIIFGNDGLGGKHQDGHDTLRWIAKQEWSDGKVLTMGGSALGIVQNMAAPNAPAALKGMVVHVAFSDYYHQAAYQGGVWRKELLEGWLKGQKMEDVNLKTFLERSTYDDFWKGLNAEAHADKVDAPGLYLGGWYDIFLQGTLNSFTAIQERGGPNARGKNFLVIGPTAHGAFTSKVTYPDAAKVPLGPAAQLDIYSHWLKGDKKGVEKLKPVHYYVMGDTEDRKAPGNFWRSADAWPPPAKETAFYFHSDNGLNREKPAAEKQLRYKYDPADPVPTVGGQNLLISKGPMDQREVESRKDVLLFTTEALTEPIEVTGRITAKLPRHRLHGETLRRVPRRQVDAGDRRHSAGVAAQRLREGRAAGGGEGLRGGCRSVVYVPHLQQGAPHPRRGVVVQRAAVRAERQHRGAAPRARQVARRDEHPAPVRSTSVPPRPADPRGSQVVPV
jgi:predicted acyl esterase